MNRSLPARIFLTATLPLALLLAGCSVQDAAENAVSDAASKVTTAAADEVRNQVCALVEDGLVSLGEQELLGGLVGAAESAGIPAEITTPMRQIADAGDQVPEDSVKNLQDACA
ncbi:hypothetical protein V1638_11950 [Pseudarthrobacter sp. J64]|uniref:hypothetical protein n=1 Tax=Pseudarthrobacter sp. J64 TaxID=3116485 RepID=UPI002E809737|nr:hypothetical protein [Pseudarthrobacter sp. J64]MEE2570103.1 hypothetical protein [Pseudarthrobacter sp. J64]